MMLAVRTLDAVMAGTSTQPHGEGWMIVFTSAAVLSSALGHWRFKSGWQMTSGRMKPSPTSYPTYLALLYGALPLTIAFVGATVALVLMRFDLTAKNSALTGLFLLAAATMFGGAIWSVKEFYSPTARRTPDWLRQKQDRG